MLLMLWLICVNDQVCLLSTDQGMNFFISFIKQFYQKFQTQTKTETSGYSFCYSSSKEKLHKLPLSSFWTFELTYTASGLFRVLLISSETSETTVSKVIGSGHRSLWSTYVGPSGDGLAERKKKKKYRSLRHSSMVVVCRKAILLLPSSTLPCICLVTFYTTGKGHLKILGSMIQSLMMCLILRKAKAVKCSVKVKCENGEHANMS